MTCKMVITLWVCLLTAFQTFGQPSAKNKSAEIYEFGSRIQENAREKIWMDFDFRRYTRPKSDENGGFLIFSTDPDNQDSKIFNWRVIDDYFLNHSLKENLSITFHEAFHAFERDPNRRGVKWGAENSLLIFEYQESSARSNALFSIESQILRDALETKSASDLKKKVREFLAVRRLRQNELESRFVEFEKGAELNEGLAEYAGTMAVALGIQAAAQKRINLPFGESSAEDFLNKKYEKLDSITKIGKNIRLKFYYTGSAQGFLLDRLMPDWKTEIQIYGKSLQDLLAESVGKPLSANRSQSILNKLAYEKILADEEKSVAERKAANNALLNQTLNQTGRKFIIDFSALTNPSGIQNFDPMNVTMVTPNVRVHTRHVKFGNEKLTADFSQPVVEDLKTKRYITVIPANEIETAIVDGATVDLKKTSEIRFDENLLIKSQNFSFEAASAGIIKISGDEVLIHLTNKN